MSASAVTSAPMTTLEKPVPAALAAAVGGSKVTFQEDGKLLFKYDGPGMSLREMDLVHMLAVKVRPSLTPRQ